MAAIRRLRGFAADVWHSSSAADTALKHSGRSRLLRILLPIGILVGLVALAPSLGPRLGTLVIVIVVQTYVVGLAIATAAAYLRDQSAYRSENPGGVMAVLTRGPARVATLLGILACLAALPWYGYASWPNATGSLAVVLASGLPLLISYWCWRDMGSPQHPPSSTAAAS